MVRFSLEALRSRGQAGPQYSWCQTIACCAIRTSLSLEVKEFKAKQEKKIEEDKKKAEKKAAGETEEAAEEKVSDVAF